MGEDKDQDDMQDRAHDPLPLTGLRILDFGHTVMGPSCGLVLADLGADVTRIEPIAGDRTRRLGGFGAGFFAAFNRNKSSIGIDLKTADGRRVAEQLIRNSDVLIENFAPKTMQRLGLDWPMARRLNPKLVYCSMKGYLSGPYEELPALDEVVQMQSGLAFMTGPAGRPLRAGASVVDILGGMFGVIAILAALREREATGLGQLVRSSLYESAVFLMSQHLAVSATSAEPLQPMPEKKIAWAVYDIFQTADRPVFVGVTSNKHWERLREQFRFGEWAHEAQFSSQDGRLAARDVLMNRISFAFAKLPAEVILAGCRKAKVPCAPVNAPEDLAEDEHLACQGGMHSIDIAPGLSARLPALPIEMGQRRLPLRAQPPLVGSGAHNRLREAGLRETEIDALAATGVLTIDGREQ
ncbi:MAG: CoA transferase [Pseudomonadota bacterium]